MVLSFSEAGVSQGKGVMGEEDGGMSYGKLEEKTETRDKREKRATLQV